jgi:hypothetical protein
MSNANLLLEDYKKRMGFSPPNLEKLKLAFEHVHRIREFEITLYWTRTNYFWGFQVAFFAAFGLLAQAIVADGAENEKLTWLLACSCVLCFFSTIFCILWLCMLSGAKFWQSNWERHLDAMEDELTGPLYKTYFVPSNYRHNESPFSVTKVNQAIVVIVLIMWMLFLGITGFYLFEHLSCQQFIPAYNLGIIVMLFLLLVLSAFIVNDRVKLRMVNLGQMGKQYPDTTHLLVMRETLLNHDHT